MLTYLVNGNLEEVGQVTDQIRETGKFLEEKVAHFNFYPTAHEDSFNLEVNTLEDSINSYDKVAEFTVQYPSIILSAFNNEEIALAASSMGVVEVL